MTIAPVPETSPHESVAEEVRAMLGRRRLSASQVARELGWSHMYMSRRTTGQTPFDVNDLVALAKVLDVPVTAFFEGLEAGHSTYRRSMDKTSQMLPFGKRLQDLPWSRAA